MNIFDSMETRPKSVTDLFNEELNLINTDSIKQITEEVLSELPLDPFLYKGASSSGKYHPTECNGIGGLTLHTKYAIQAGLVLIDQDTNLKHQFQYDLIISALLLHDGFKYGLNGTEQYTVSDHPELMASYLANKAELTSDKDRKHILHELEVLIRAHHGKWGDSPCRSLAEKYVHIADLIASRADKIRFNPE